MRYLKALLASLLALSLAAVASAGEDTNMISLYAGANGAWFDGPATQFPADVELGGAASASLSPHLSAVASSWYGFDHSYFRYAAGGQATITDTENKNLSVSLGMLYQGSSETDLGIDGWSAGVAIGWVPNPEKWPNIALGANSYIGIDPAERSTRTTIGVRYRLNLK